MWMFPGRANTNGQSHGDSAFVGWGTARRGRIRVPENSFYIRLGTWYLEKPSKRFAMINGLIIAEGAVVEGMKVEEIYPDRVRFLHNDQHLEISIK